MNKNKVFFNRQKLLKIFFLYEPFCTEQVTKSYVPEIKGRILVRFSIKGGGALHF